jgi:hypothetical protein
MTMQNEQMDFDASLALKQEAQDFPDPFYDYIKKGYFITRNEDITENGKDFFVISLKKNSVVVNGQELSNNADYLIDKKSFYPTKKVL